MPLSGRPGDPAVVSWGGRRIDAFARSSDDRLEHWYTESPDHADGPPDYETWWGPAYLAGPLRSDPVAVCRAQGRIDVFAEGAGARLLHWWWDADQGRMVGPESRLGWWMVHQPAVVSWGTERLDVFARSSLGGLRRWAYDGRWRDDDVDNYGNLGLTGDPAAVTTGPGQIHVFARVDDGGLQYFRWDDRRLVESYPLGGSINAALQVVSWAPDRLDVFGTDGDGNNIHWGCTAPFTRQRWFGPERNLPADMPPVEGASSRGPDRREVVGRGQGGLAYCWWDAPARQWRGPEWFGFPDRRPVPLARRPLLDVFARTHDGGIQRWHSYLLERLFGPWNLRPHQLSQEPPAPPTGWERGVPADPDFLLRRPDDHVLLGVRWSGCEVVPGDPAVLRVTRGSARILLIFPPQHVLEEVAPAWQPGTALAPTHDPSSTFGFPVWQSRRSGPSRLAFTVPEGTEVPLTVTGLLAALDQGQVLAGSGDPAEDLTAVELPGRMVMSPQTDSGTTTVAHPAQPVALAGGGVGLWRTRLRAEAPVTRMVVHDTGEWDPPFRVPLTLGGRRLVRAQHPPPALDRLELSALGGSLSARGSWDAVEWEHQASLGRDQSSRLLTRGLLFPFGHRAEYEEVSDRTTDPYGAEPVAVIRKRSTLTVTEPVRRLTDPAVLRTFPFTDVEITTLSYPDLADADWLGGYQRMPVELSQLEARLAEWRRDLERLLRQVDADWVGGTIVVEAHADEDEAAERYLSLFVAIEELQERIALVRNTRAETVDWYFWPERPAGTTADPRARTLVRVPVRLTGPGGTVALSVPMLFVADLDLPETATLTAFDSLSHPAAAGGPVAEYAHRAGPVQLVPTLLNLAGTGGPEGSTRPAPGDVHEVHRLNFSGGLSGRTALPRLGRPDGPEEQRWAAEVALPALRTMLGDARLAGLRFSPEFEQRGPAADIAFQLSAPLQASFAKAADRAGGLVAPILEIDAISRTRGLANRAAADAQDPARLLAGTTLLGIDLATLLDGVTRQPEIVSELAAGQLPAVRMSWTDVPLENASPPFQPVEGRPAPTFTMSVEHGPARTETRCVVRNFGLLFPVGRPLVELVFDELEYLQRDTREPILAVRGVDASFRGDLDLLQVLQENVDLGPAAPVIEVSPRGITARYALPVPDVQAGAFVMQNLVFSAAVWVPFDTAGDTASVSLGFGSRLRPFNLSVLLLGGGGYVDLAVDRSGLRRLEISLEFGALASVNFLLVDAEVHVLGGIRFTMLPDRSVELTGFVRIGGSVEIFGLISVAVELTISLGYQSTGNKLVGQAILVIEVDLTLFSESVELDTGVWEIAGGGAPEREIEAGAGVSPADWQAYRSVFAGSEPV